MEKGKIARILITRRCTRDCSYCCNKYTEIMKHGIFLTNIKALQQYEAFCFTGGEPLLEPTITTTLAEEIRRKFPGRKIWLYTSIYRPLLLNFLSNGIIDGVHYTIHQEATTEDIFNLKTFQSFLHLFPNASFRLYVHKEVKLSIYIIPNLWNRVEINRWNTEKELLNRNPKGLPVGEDLFFLSPEFK